MTESQLLRLGNLVWHDGNNNGQVDADEAGIPGVTVQLFRAGDDPTTAMPLQTDMTDEHGNYLFENLEPGRYFVYIPTPPDTYPLSSTPTDDMDNGEDNDDNGAQSQSSLPVQSPVITLALGTEPTNDGDGASGELTVDFGFFAPASLGNRVWYDADGDGLQDGEETGVPGVIVTLYRADGTIVATTRTDADGFYEFVNLPPGDYFLEFEPRVGYRSTRADQGSDDTVDSDVDVATKRTIVTTLEPGEYDMSWDYGIFIFNDRTGSLTLPAAIGNRVWLDEDRDGVQGDPLYEPGVPGVTVKLYDSQGQLVAIDVTDENGEYFFPNLLPGEYYIEFVLSDGYVITKNGTEPTSDIDSNVDPATGWTPVELLEAGEVNPTLDAGIYQVPTNLGDEDEPEEELGQRLYLPLIVR